MSGNGQDDMPMSPVLLHGVGKTCRFGCKFNQNSAKKTSFSVNIV